MKEITPKDVLIGYKLKQLRLAKGYTQGKIADFLGVSSQHYGTLERGVNAFSLDNILKLCDFYNVPIISIIGEIRSADRKRKKESEKIIRQMNSLSEEHKEAVVHMVKFYTQLERKTTKSGDEKEFNSMEQFETENHKKTEKIMRMLDKSNEAEEDEELTELKRCKPKKKTN